MLAQLHQLLAALLDNLSHIRTHLLNQSRIQQAVSVQPSSAQFPFLRSKDMALVPLHSYPAHFRIGSEWHNYAYTSIY